VLCYHQLRNWSSGDSQYNRISLICPPKLDPAAPLYTLALTCYLHLEWRHSA